MEILLYQTLSSDDNERKYATNILKQQEYGNYSMYIKSLCQVLVHEDMTDNIRMSAGLLLKNSLSAEKSQNISLGWFFIDQQIKHEIKSAILSLLSTDKRNVANTISQVLTSLASVDIPLGEWNDLVAILANIVTRDQVTSNMKRTTLQTIGYLCESLDPHVLSLEQKNMMLTAIIHGARREEKDVQVRITAIQALCNSLRFIKVNFENKIERDFIMKVIFEAATLHINSTVELQVAAFECLIHVFQLYYDKMDDYMASSVFNLSLTSLNRVSDPPVMIQAIELWSTICTLELQFNKEQISYHFADQFVTYILPNLLNGLIKARDTAIEDDDQEWNVVDASAFCLSQFAVLCKESVVPQTIHFIEQKLLLPEYLQSLVLWNDIEAALKAFGCILKGPSPIKTKPLVEKMLPLVLSYAQHTTTPIRIAASWTLSQIIQESIQVLDVNASLTAIIPIIHLCLYDTNKKVIHNACLSILYLAKKLKGTSLEGTHGILETGPLSIYTQKLLDSLSQIGQKVHYRQDATYAQVLYESMSMLITHSRQDCTHLIISVTEFITSELERLLENEDRLKVKEERDAFEFMQSNLSGVLLSCIYRLSSKIQPFSDKIMRLILKISHLYFSKSRISSAAVEDAYLLVSAMIASIGPAFAVYVDSIRPYLPLILLRDNDRLCLIGVGILSDLSCTGVALSECMPLLFEVLQSPYRHGEVKPAAISCMGDVAQMMGPAFMPYVETAMMALQQAGNVQTDPRDESTAQYVDALRASSIDAFIGMLQGLSADETTKAAFEIKVANFLLFVSSVASDTRRSDRLNGAIFGLLGDVARIYGQKIQASLIESLLNTLIIENLKGDRYFSRRTHELATWAQQAVRSAYQ